MEGLMQDFPLTLHHIVWRMERLFSHKEVVTKNATGVHRTTYGEIARRSRQLASALGRLGVRYGDRVATLAWNNYRHLELYYAVPCMGAVLHTLNLRLSPEQLAFIANDAGDSVIVVDDNLLPLLEKFMGEVKTLRHVIVISDDSTPHEGMLDYESLVAAESANFAWPSFDEKTAAAMCYTSGTTGHPKGVVYTHRSTMLHAMVALQGDALGIRESDVVLPIVPMFHANAWGFPYESGMAGAGLVLPDRWMGDPETMIQLTIAEKVTILAGVPTIWIGIDQKLAGRRLTHVREVFSGGSAVPRKLFESMDAHGLELVHLWGMTETSPLATASRPPQWIEGERLALRATQGAPVPGIELRISDLESGEELPWDGVAFGEIQVRGPWVAAGYHNAADPTRMTADGWFRTGDVATVSPDGYVAIVDRAKDVIKSGGEWVSSVELENAIMAHPKVLEAAVIGVPHPKWQERPVGYVVPRPEFSGALGGDEIIAHLAQHFMKWWLPDEIRFIDQIPKTSVGKFDKKALRKTAAPLASP